jgi:microcystin degradation protein MlrC
MFYGSQAHLGPMAALRINGSGIIVVVGVTRCQNLDQEFFRAVGIEPADHKIVCVKSAIHFIADYGRISDHILFAVSPGANPCDLKQLNYSKLRPGIKLLS